MSIGAFTSTSIHVSPDTDQSIIAGWCGLRGVANAGPANLPCNPTRWLFELLQQASQQQEAGIPAASCKPDKLVPPDQLGIEKHAALKQNCGWQPS